jgi:hypothetical protein
VNAIALGLVYFLIYPFYHLGVNPTSWGIRGKLIVKNPGEFSWNCFLNGENYYYYYYYWNFLI